MHMLFGGIKPVCFQSVFFNRSLAEDRVCGAQEWEYRHDVTKEWGNHCRETESQLNLCPCQGIKPSLPTGSVRSGESLAAFVVHLPLKLSGFFFF